MNHTSFFSFQSFILSIALFFAIDMNAQSNFQRVYGGGFFDWGNEIIETGNGEYAVAGATESFGTREAFLMKLDCKGDILWNRILNETPDQQSQAMTVIKTYDGSFMVTGETQSYATGRSDAFLWKVNSAGTTQWFRSFGTSEWELAYDVIEMDDSGFVAVGSERLNGSGNSNVFLIRTDKNGVMLWSKSFGGTAGDVGYSLVKRPGGDILVTGYTNSFGSAPSNLLLWKVDINGNTIFSRAYGITGASSLGNDIINTADGGYIVGGSVSHLPGGRDYYVIKFDVMDNIQWAKSYETQGDNNNEACNGIIQTNDNGYALAGENQNALINHMDESLVKIDNNGNAQWGWVYGGSNVDWMQSVIQTPDSGYLTVGYSFALGQPSIGGSDIFLIKTKSDGSSGCNEQAFTVRDSSLSPQLFTGGASINFGVQLSHTPSVQNNVFPIEILCENLAPFTLPVSITPDSSICIGDSIILSVSTTGNSFLWSNGATTQSIKVAPGSTSSYTVSVSHSSCYSPSGAITTVTVNSTPTLTISASDTSLCSGDSLTLSAIGNGTGYTWNTGTTTATFTVYPTATTTYIVTSSIGNCPATDSISISVSAGANAVITGDTILCLGETASLSGAGGASYYWSNGSSGLTINVNPTINTIYTLTATAGNCIDTTTILVVVNNLSFTDAGVDTTIVIGSGIRLYATGGITYQWFPSQGLNCISCPNPYASPETTTKYYVIVTDANGCTGIDSIMVFVKLDCTELFIPNAFSPNEDGENDIYHIMGAETCIKEFLFRIYDRWGEVVFDTNDIKKGWNGTFRDKKCNTGVFTYYLEATDKTGNLTIKKGNISLIR